MKIATAFILAAILACSGAAAFGISYQFMQDNTLKLHPGQEYLFKLTVQNMDSEPILVNLSVDSPIATIAGDSMLQVPAASYESYLVLNITIPKDAEIGKTYNVNYVVYPVDQETGQVAITVRYARSFNIMVVQEEKALQQQPVEIISSSEPMMTKQQAIAALGALLFISIIMALIYRKSKQVSSRLSQDGGSSKSTGIAKLAREHKTEQTEAATQNQKPMEQSTRKRPLIEAVQGEEFMLQDGRKLSSLNQLCDALESMKDEVFCHHVNDSKNDFANWTLHALRQPDAATRIFKAEGREEMIKAIRDVI